nr:hypothetical protein [Rhodococcus sp. 06-1059B-a]
MPGLDLRVNSRVVATAGVGVGRGRLRSLTFETAVHGRAAPGRTGRYTLAAPTVGGTGLQWERADAASALSPVPDLAAGQ